MFKGFITSCYVLFAMSINLDLKILTECNLRVCFELGKVSKWWPEKPVTNQTPVVRTLDNSIHQINHYPVKTLSSENKTNHAICWIVIYPVDGFIWQISNNLGQKITHICSAKQLNHFSFSI